MISLERIIASAQNFRDNQGWHRDELIRCGDLKVPVTERPNTIKCTLFAP